MFLTPRMCAKQGMVASQYAIFVRLFPDGHETDATMAAQGTAAGLDLNWIIHHFAEASAVQRSDAAVAVALEDPRQALQIAQQAYEAARNAMEAAQALALDMALIPPIPTGGPNMTQYLAMVGFREAMQAAANVPADTRKAALQGQFVGAFAAT